MRFGSNGCKGLAAGLTVAAAMLALPGSSLAATFYASDDGTGSNPCAQPDPCSLAGAVAFANGNPGQDTVQVLGALDQDQATEGQIYVGPGTDLIGSGSGTGGTRIFGGTGASPFTIDDTSSAQDLAVEADNVAAVVIYGGGDLRDASVKLTAAGGTGGGTGVEVRSSAATTDTELTGLTVSEDAGAGATGLQVDPGADRVLVEDSTIDSQRGATVDGGVGSNTSERLVLRRSTVVASQFGLQVRNTELYASSSVLYAASGNSFQAVRIANSATYDGAASSAELRQLTMDGSASAGSGGVTVGISSTAGTGRSSTATVRDSIVYGFAVDLMCSFSPVAGGAIDIARSDFTSTSADANCNFTDSGGNVDLVPGYTDQANHDYHLTSSSPLIDTAGAAAPTGEESTTDRDGNPRIEDGNGDGQADRDMGAFELPPDTTPPETTIDSGPSDDSTTNDPTPTFGFSSSEANSTFECSIDGDPFTSCTSPDTTTTLADGQHTFAVRATDRANNTDATPASRTFTVDTTAPTTAITSGPAAGAYIKDSTPTFGFSANDAGATMQCKLDGGAYAGCSSPKTLGPLANGTHAFRVRAIDGAGNIGVAASRVFHVDTVAPTVTITGPATVKAGGRTAQATFRFSASEPATFKCRIDAAAFKPCTSPYTTPRLAIGRHTLIVQATDRAKNVRRKAKAFTIVRR